MADLGSLLGSAGIGGAIGKAIVSLELDTKKYQAEMKAAQAQTVASTNSMSSGLAAFGGIAKAGLTAAAVGVVAFAANGIKAASDLGEQVNKSNVVFGQNAAAVKRWAEGGADAFGLSTRAALEAASGFGQMLQSAGFATEASAGMSKALVELAGDLASFNNIDPTVALEKLRGGLAGEAEPLRQLGVFLSEAAVLQEAYQSGIAKTGDELSEAQKIQARYNIILEQSTLAQGDFQRTADSVPNTIRSMRAEFENVSAEVGEKLLPVVSDLLGTFKTLIPVLGLVADHFNTILTLALGFAAIKYLPALITSLAAAFVRLQVAVGASFAAQGAASGVFAALGRAVPTVTAAVIALTFAMKELSEREEEANAELVEGINTTLKDFSQGSSDANANLFEFATGFAFLTDEFLGANQTLDATQLAIGGLRQEFVKGSISVSEFKSALSILGLDVHDVNRIFRETTNSADGFTHHITAAGKTVQNFASLTNKEMKEFKSGLVESLQVSAGQFEKLNDAFDTTPKELAKQLRLAVQIARTAQRDLREIAEDKSISDGVKKALAELPANQRHAWAEGGKAVKKQIEQDAIDLQRLNAKSAREAANAFGDEAKSKGKGAGHDLAAGVAQGIESGGGLVTAAARKLIADAEAAMRDEAKAESPSKVMKELGLDLMEGLYQGITSGAQKVIDAERKSIEKLIEGFQKGLDKVKGLASSFAGTISGAIGGFGDIGGAFGSAEAGTSLSTIIQTQLHGAEALADVLEALKRQGASRATLGQVAETGTAFGQAILQGGPEQIREMNQALADIAALAKETGKGLSEKFFGQEIARLERRLEKQNDQLKELVELERIGHSHAIILNGQKVSEAVRDELVKTGKRNPGAGIP